MLLVKVLPSTSSIRILKLALFDGSPEGRSTFIVNVDTSKFS